MSLKKWIMALLWLVFTLSRPLVVLTQEKPRSEIPRAHPGLAALTEATPSPDSLSELITQKRWKEATKVAAELARARPNDPLPSYWLGVARLQLGDAIGAVQALRAAERLSLDTTALHEALGIAYYNLRQFVLFEQQMEKASKQTPDAFVPLYYLGLYHESIRNDFSRALEFFKKAARLDPKHAKTFYYMGYCFEALGRRADARQAYETAVQLVEKQPGNFAAPYQGLAGLLLETDPQRALELASRAVEVEPALDSSHVILAKVYEQLGKLPEAAEELRAAIRLNPSNAVTRFVLARAYNKLGNNEAAEAELKMFEKLNRLYAVQ